MESDKTKATDFSLRRGKFKKTNHDFHENFVDYQLASVNGKILSKSTMKQLIYS